MLLWDYVIKNGDRLKLYIAEFKGPSRDWLSNLKSTQARIIRLTSGFKQELKEDNIIMGKKMVANCRWTKGNCSFWILPSLNMLKNVLTNMALVTGILFLRPLDMVH